MAETSRERVYFSTNDSFAPVPDVGSPVRQSIMPLFSMFDGGYHSIGTGFIVAGSGLMMTAAHVIAWANRNKSRKVNEKGEYYDHWELYALWISNERSIENKEDLIGGFIPITHVWCPDTIDIALCWLDSPVNIESNERLTYPVIRLSPGYPKVGENISGVGYYGKAETTATDENVLIDYDSKSAITTGKIIEVHPSGRDAGMYPFPCFRIDARFESGMSGGPIFNEAGYACGVISGGLPPSELDPTYLSYGSIIGPALGIEIEMVIPPGAELEKMLFYDYVKKGCVITDESFQLFKT